MSSETLTDAGGPSVRDSAPAHGDSRSVHLQADRDKESALQPWQFFVLAGLACASAATFLARGQGLASIVLITVLMGSAALVGIATLRSILPLVSRAEDRTPMIGRRTRVALEREKTLVLRSIKELEFDRAMGKLSESDWNEMSGRLRARAARLMRQIDAGGGYREQIEHDLMKRLGEMPVAPQVARACAACGTPSDPDARFCKNCGERL
jgi:hypothetical protein